MHRAHVLAFVVGFALALVAACGPPPVKKCTPSSCHGCCDSSGECLAGTALFFCGTGGEACQRCDANQVCSEGACALFADGDYDASFDEDRDASVDWDAGVYHPPDAGAPDSGMVTDAGRPDAGRADAGPPDAGDPVSFSADIEPIFATHCNGCHSWLTTADLVNAVAVRSSCAGNIIVIPGNLTGGVLYGKISGAPACGGTMPNGQPPLINSNPAKVDLIRRWILQGAPNN